MDETIKGAFDKICEGLVIDAQWLTKLNRFRIGFTVRNEEHIEFFGGNLFGVNTVRFTPLDRAFLFEELLGVDEAIVTVALDKVPTVIRRFNVTGDNFNNACIWLIHRILNDPKLSNQQKTEGMMNITLVMNYRFFTSLIYQRFRYPANREVAMATYAGLSRKFAIKQYGNWNRVFEERAKEIINPRSIHYKTFVDMKDDLQVRYAISDIQGRLRSMATLLMREHMMRSDEKDRIVSTTSMMEHDGDVIIKDRTQALANYGRYIKSIASDKNNFIKADLVHVVENLMSTMPPKQFLAVLEYISDTARRIDRKEVDDLFDHTLIHAFGYLFQNRQVIRSLKDTPAILDRLKGTYSSSRNRDQVLLDLRAETEDIVKKVTKIRHAGNIAAIRTGVLLYIVARAITKTFHEQ